MYTIHWSERQCYLAVSVAQVLCIINTQEIRLVWWQCCITYDTQPNYWMWGKDIYYSNQQMINDQYSTSTIKCQSVVCYWREVLAKSSCWSDDDKWAKKNNRMVTKKLRASRVQCRRGRKNLDWSIYQRPELVTVKLAFMQKLHKSENSKETITAVYQNPLHINANYRHRHKFILHSHIILTAIFQVNLH